MTKNLNKPKIIFHVCDGILKPRSRRKGPRRRFVDTVFRLKVGIEVVLTKLCRRRRRCRRVFGGLLDECRKALKLLCKHDDAAYRSLSAEFALFCAEDGAPSDIFTENELLLPHLVWSQAVEKFPLLAPLLMKLFSLPTSAAGGERNHKAAKHVHRSSTRPRLSKEKVEMQTAISFNRHSLNHSTVSRGSGMDHVNSLTFSAPIQNGSDPSDEDDDVDWHEQTFLCRLEDVHDTSELSNNILFALVADSE